MTQSCSLFLPWVPYPKGRPRFSGKGFAYTPAKTKQAEHSLRMMLFDKSPPKLEGPLCLELIFFLKPPKSLKKGVIWNDKRPDIDNYVKALTDAANGILWDDDAQIAALHAYKRYDRIRIGVELFLRQIDPKALAI